MIVVSNRIFVNPDYNEPFEARFKERAAFVDQMPGFVAFTMLRPSRPGKPYVIMTYWQTEAHFQAWTQSDTFREGHARSGTLPDTAFTAPTELEVAEIIATTASIVPMQGDS